MIASDQGTAPAARALPLPAVVLILAALGLAAWANGFSTPFVFDDEIAVVGNPSIRRLSWSALAAPDRRVMAGRPVANLSLAVSYAIGGLEPWAYHAGNLLLHVLAALALYGIVRRTLPRAGQPPGVAASRWLPLAVAAVWLVHPLQTDAVTYVTQRNEVLMGLCYLVTLYAAIRAWDGGAGWTAASVVACAVGMGSKEVMVSAPLMVVFYDRVFLAPSFAAAWARRRALYAGLAATWAIIAALLLFTPRTETIGFDAAISWHEYLFTQAGVLVQYLRLALWPDRLCIDHGVWVARSMREIVPPGLVVLALLGATIAALVRWRPAGFLGAWFFGILAPTSSFVPIVTEVMAERRMYLPLAAVVAFVVVGAARAGQRLAPRLWSQAGPIAAVGLVILLSLATMRRNLDYRSEAAILVDTLRKRPDNYRARNNLGHLLFQAGRYEAARAQLLEAVRLEPRFANAHYNLATVYLEEGRDADAAAEYERTLQLDPRHAEAHVNLGTALLSLDRVDEAAAHYAEAVRLDPAMAAAQNNYGMSLLRQGRLAEAEARFKRAIRLDRREPQYRENLRTARAARAAGR